MRYVLIMLLCILFNSNSFCQDNDGYEIKAYMNILSETELERNRKEAEFRDPATSPLPKEEISSFEGLHYFDSMLDKYIVWASFELVKNGREFEMKTTTDRLPLYKDYALLTFKIDNKTFTLHAYQNVAYSKSEEYANEVFIPFKDHTNGEETYGGGRYLDIKIPEGNEIVINFGMAYNPYCSYNKKYSCPIPPNENHLDIAIRAGELKYY